MAAAGPSFYDVLGLRPSARQEEIDEAYRLLAFQLHPDAPNGDAARFADISEAYHILRDPARRCAYDASHHQANPLTEDQIRQEFDRILADWQDWLDAFVRESSPTGGFWLTTGTLGGAALGATVAGPVGALLGGAAGLAAGAVRATTSKSIAEHWQSLSGEQKEKALSAIGRVLGQPLGSLAAAGPAAGARASGQADATLTDAEVRRMRAAPAGEGEAECKVCLENAVALINKPCRHACLCPACFRDLAARRGPQHAPPCPICRSPIYAVSRVFL